MAQVRSCFFNVTVFTYYLHKLNKHWLKTGDQRRDDCCSFVGWYIYIYIKISKMKTKSQLCNYQSTKLLGHLMGLVGIKNDILSTFRALEKLVLCPVCDPLSSLYLRQTRPDMGAGAASGLCIKMIMRWEDWTRRSLTHHKAAALLASCYS